MRIQIRTRLRALAAMGVAAALSVAAIAAASPAAAAAIDASAPSNTAPPDIVRSVSDAGFAHPGVGVTADNLENMREQVLAGVDPWASYYDAMTQTKYAAADFRAENAQTGSDTPKNDAYASAAMRSSALRDSIGAMTQALEYVVTGDEAYRANALHVLRTWSNLEPGKYEYFADAHIHTGVPLYYFLYAAEIIRSTDPSNDSSEGYDLRWTADDEQRIQANLIHPTLETFLFSKNRLWNQHLYGVIGMIAAAIYLDDDDLYKERVEWFSVNAGYESEHDLYGGDVNGALAALFRSVPADASGNTTGAPFVQHMEMLRDQAHGQGDVDLLVAIARLLENQGTNLDPVAGTVSTAGDAVSAYRFLDDRILDGADTFDAFMMGEEVPYIPATEGGAISQAYRGRLQDPLSEAYLQYTFVADVDVEEEAPHVAALYEQRDGPLYYYGTGVQNFWNERGSDYTGAEYWVAFPEELAGRPESVAPVTAGPELEIDRAGWALGSTRIDEDADGTAYARLDPTGDGALAVRRAIWSDRTKPSLVGIRVRSDAVTTLELSRTSIDAPFASVTVPDTHGEWRYVSVDLDLAVTPGAIGDNIAVLRAAGGGSKLDVAGVIAQANGALTPPTFADAPALDVVAVQGETWSRSIQVTDTAGDPTIEVQEAPDGVTISAWTISWKPTAAGTSSMTLVADDGTTTTALPVDITIVADRGAAIESLTSRLGVEADYTSVTWSRMQERLAAARAGVEDASDAEFSGLLGELGDAITGLLILNPTLADGSLAYGGIVTAPALTTAQMLALVDGDNQTSWGDQRVSAIVFDFGPGYRVQAERFGVLARDTFANRAEGTNVYGSDDGATWTLLTEHPNVGQDSAMEWIDVRPVARGDRFRFLKFQVDEPGVPSDPAYPGIWSIADIRIDGVRSEAVGLMDVVTLDSPDAVAGRVVPGDRVRLHLSGPAGNADVSVDLFGAAAEVERTAAGMWTATSTVPVGAAIGAPVVFSVRFTTPNGDTADAIGATTDGSKLFVSTGEGLVDGALRDAVVLRPDGIADAAWTRYAANMLDGNALTHSDTRLNAGTYGHVWDLGADAWVSLTGAELLVRQDGYGTSRIADLRLEGSNDLATWTRLTPAVPQRVLEWQQWAVADHAAYRYLRVANGQILGIAELRLFGAVTPVDRTAPVVTVKDGADATIGEGGLYRSVSFKLSDEGNIDRLTLNGVEKDLTDNPWSDLNNVVPGVFGAVEGANELLVFDRAGNATTVRFTLDTVGPEVTVKDGETFSVGSDGVYAKVSFKLHAAPSQVDRIELNGVEKDLVDNPWSDLNFVMPGVFGAVRGENTLIAYDALGNGTKVVFNLQS